jgi:hypothetical protein
VMYFLWIIHLHVICRRAVSVNITRWSRRREVLVELLATMYESYDSTMKSVMGRSEVPMFVQRNIRNTYRVTVRLFDEALQHEGPGADLALLSYLMNCCPLPRPEDVPMFTYYTLVHYIRFHLALFDRLSDDDFCRGKYHFYAPTDDRIFKAYSAVELDEVARSWVNEAPNGSGGEERDASADRADGKKGEEEKDPTNVNA